MTDPLPRVSVKSKERGKLTVVLPDGKEESYHSEGIRTLWLEMLQLRAFDTAQADRSPLKPFTRAIHGRATLKDRSICVIGDPSTVCREISIGFRPVPTAEEAKVEDANRGIEDGETKGQCATAMLAFNRAHWEIGDAEEWWVEINLPLAGFEQLNNAVTAGTLSQLSVGLHMNDLYTSDPYAPPSVRVAWFLFAGEGERDLEHPGPVTGYVSSLFLRHRALDLRPASATDEQSDKAAPLPDAPSTRASERIVLQGTEVVLAGLASITTQLVRLHRAIFWVGLGVVAALLWLANK